jgi:hypothetical protein
MPRGAKPGERRGGRSKGTLNKATAEAKVAIEELARGHAATALTALVQVATKGQSEAARVSAAVALLDRGYGKPRQAVEHAGENGGPVSLTIRRVIVDPRNTDSEVG